MNSFRCRPRGLCCCAFSPRPCTLCPDLALSFPLSPVISSPFSASHASILSRRGFCVAPNVQKTFFPDIRKQPSSPDDDMYLNMLPPRFRSCARRPPQKTLCGFGRHHLTMMTGVSSEHFGCYVYIVFRCALSRPFTFSGTARCHTRHASKYADNSFRIKRGGRLEPLENIR